LGSEQHIYFAHLLYIPLLMIRVKIKIKSDSDLDLKMEVICKGNQRKYYRFRADRFYGGIATADCMGCNMDCAFCWSYRTRIHPERFGDFYTPEEVAERLVKIALLLSIFILYFSICILHLITQNPTGY